MAGNKKLDGTHLTFTAPTGGVVTGVPVLIGALVVIPLVTAAQTVRFACDYKGVWEFPKETGAAWTEGQKIYWDNGNLRATGDAVDGFLLGTAYNAAQSADAVGEVLLAGAPAESLEGIQAAIADLVAITGGEAPTEAEHNLVVAKVNAILAMLRIRGDIAP